jgi:predicted metal-dependent hydrolase
MVLAAAIFWAKVLQHQAVMMNEAGCLYSLDEWRSLVRFLFVHPGSMRKVARDFLRYFNRGFHPRDIDDGALLEAWKKRAA